ncbi:hypothetical protein FHU37_004162 [Allostreptomyces psammosilenae]|uniref:Uncharacterized protein n=1 Tax=Allostreptomyces psammosilenae TaxID=1892865 RepID=A0A852ZYI8_9ACTN|nr:hypothetical protein [Allostreptomyces psammosilenae]
MRPSGRSIRYAKPSGPGTSSPSASRRWEASGPPRSAAAPGSVVEPAVEWAAESAVEWAERSASRSLHSHSRSGSSGPLR